MDDIRLLPAAPVRTSALRNPLLGNRLLAALPPGDLALLRPHLQQVVLPARAVMFEPGEEVAHAHFPGQGTVVALVCVMEDGRAVETAMLGCESAVGALISAGCKPASARAVTLVAGPALRIASDRLEAAKAASTALRDLMHRAADTLLAQVLQSAACNALHPIEARLSRWLLMLQDRTGTRELPITQEYLAELLGVQRTTVNRVLADLASAGAVDLRRGRLGIVGRARLQAFSCECHAAVQRHLGCVAPVLDPARVSPRQEVRRGL